MDEDINSFLWFCGANTASANPKFTARDRIYHNRGVLLSPIVAGLLSTHNNKEEAFNWFSPFISYNNVNIRAGYNKVYRLLFSEPNCLQQTFGYAILSG
jgi:hypothetical protein